MMNGSIERRPTQRVPLLLFIILHLPFVIGLTGCVTMERPTMSFAGARLVDVDERGFDMAFEADVENPNDYAVPLAGFSYDLSVEKLPLGAGRIDPPDGLLPAGGGLRVELPVRIQFADLLDVKDALAQSGGDFELGLAGNVTYVQPDTLGLARVTQPYTFNDDLPLQQILRRPELLTSPEAQDLARTVFGRLLGR